MKKFSLSSLVILLILLSVANVSRAATVVELWASNTEFGTCNSGFTKDNFPNKAIEIKIVLQPPDDAMRTALSTAMQGGAGPDIVQTDGPAAMLQYQRGNLLEPLDAYAEKYKWKDRFAAWALDLGKTAGKLYSVPDELETMVMWYNKTLFAEKKWDLPTSMDGLAELAAKVKAAGVIPFAPAFSECQPCMEWAVTVMLSHYAGPDKVYQALSGKLPWTDPAFDEAITKLNTWMQDGWFMGGKSFLFSDTFDTSHAMFGSGKIAMNFEGTWFQDNINDFFGEKGGNKNEWDWFPIPTTFSKDPFFVIGIGSSWGVNAASKNKDATAEVMDYIFSQPTQLGLFTKCGKAPAPVNLSSDLFKDSDPRIARLYDAMSKASSSGNYGYTTWTFWPPKTNVFVYDGIAKVYDGKMTVKDYLAEMQKEFKEEFDKGLIPPLPARKTS